MGISDPARRPRGPCQESRSEQPLGIHHKVIPVPTKSGDQREQRIRPALAQCTTEGFALEGDNAAYIRVSGHSLLECVLHEPIDVRAWKMLAQTHHKWYAAADITQCTRTDQQDANIVCHSV